MDKIAQIDQFIRMASRCAVQLSLVDAHAKTRALGNEGVSGSEEQALVDAINAAREDAWERSCELEQLAGNWVVEHLSKDESASLWRMIDHAQKRNRADFEKARCETEG
ncbi:hypothetical protein FYK55_26810, partial [Roseiconus nitratireducens]